MNILITGGMGYIGGRLGQYLKLRGHCVFLGSRKVNQPPNWLPTAEVVQIDWSDYQGLMRLCCGMDVVIHAAGMNAGECFNNPTAALEFNGLASARLAESAVAAGVNRIVYLSTAHVYASPLVGTITEDTRPRNLHPYATSNLAGEDATLRATSGSKTTGTVLRLSNVFGSPVSQQINCWELLVNDLSKQAVTTKKITIRSNVKQQRDFLPMMDFCSITKNIIESEDNSLAGVINIGSGRSLNIYDIARLIQERSRKILKCDIELKYDKNLIDKNEYKLIYKTNRKDIKIKKITRKNYIQEIDKILELCICYGR